jgi:hypothetical protein
MKGKIIFFLILLFGFFGFVLAKAFFFNQKNAYGKLKITSSPTASVFIDNVAIGKTPFEERYKVGEYMLKLIPEGVATETASWNGKITVEKNITTYVNIELGSSDLTTAGEIFTMKKSETAKGGKGEIYVETEPTGAIVSLDNDEKGVATLLLENVSPGVHELSVFMPGFFKRTQKINVVSYYRVYAKFKLAVDQSQKFITKTEEKQSTESAKIKEKKYVVVLETPTGWLRVRTDASLSASESAKVKKGERYELLDEKEGWYKIKFNGNKEGLVEGEFEEGWISSSYAKKEE